VSVTTGADEIEEAVERVNTLLAQGREAYASGQAEQAVALFGQAAEDVRQLVERLPGENLLRQGLGTVHYDLGGAYLAAGRPAQAVAPLSQSLAAYAGLPATHQPDPQLLAADARARRGLAYALTGAGASAVLDVQAAIVAYVRRVDPQRVDAAYLGLSRVLMTGSDVLGAYGDPEVALVAARIGLSWCIEAARAGAVQPDEAMMIAMVRALSAERELVLGLGREEEAGNAEETLRSLGASPVTTLIARRLAGDSPGLLLPFAEAVGAAGDDDLTALLLGEPVGPLCAPVFRVEPEHLTDAGLAAGEAALRLTDEDPDSAARLGLEAHFLLAAALEQQLPQFTSRSDEVSLRWCQVLAAVASRCAADGDRDLAADLGQWGVRVSLGIDPAFAERHAAEISAAVKSFEAAGAAETTAGAAETAAGAAETTAGAAETAAGAAETTAGAAETAAPR
jgi:tetratricopeptide (TPR) repeat protein